MKRKTFFCVHVNAYRSNPGQSLTGIIPLEAAYATIPKRPHTTFLGFL